MSLASTLGLATFAERLRVKDVQLTQKMMQQGSTTGGGERRFADRAPSLWVAQVTCVPTRHAEAEANMALINSRGGGLKSLLLFPTRLPFPPSDPSGAILGATTPKLGAIADRLHIAFTGFPSGYVLPVGTYFGIIFDTSRYYLGQICEARTASGTGSVASVEIWPPLPASVSGTPNVVLKRPPAKFRITPDSAFAAASDLNFSAVQFTAEQTYSR